MFIVLVFGFVDLFNKYLLNADKEQGLDTTKGDNSEQNKKGPWPHGAQIPEGYRQYTNK